MDIILIKWSKAEESNEERCNYTERKRERQKERERERGETEPERERQRERDSKSDRKREIERSKVENWNCILMQKLLTFMQCHN